MGADYNGKISITRDGVKCKPWTEFTTSRYMVSSNFPDGSFDAAKNYCRNPDRDASGPWCNTGTGKGDWGYCDVPLCGGGY